MFRKILIPVDNSTYSNRCIDMGISLAQKFGAGLVGSHVYAARMHEVRFKQMENDLPERYQHEEQLERQRRVHDSLITEGLTLISQSYLDVLEKRCRQADVSFQRKIMEGKNFYRIIKDVEENAYDLVIIGLLGLGAVKKSLIGSVCERVVRGIRTDVLVVNGEKSGIKNKHSEARFFSGKICAAIDGSLDSLAGMNTALALGKAFNVEVEVLSAFDPHFHCMAFQSLAGVISEEAGEAFRFSDQERLHNEVIDKGLAKIYQSHLDEAKKIASEQGMEIKSSLLSGKPLDKILEYVDKERPDLLVLGRFGIHQMNGLDIGSTAENMLRLAPCHLLIVNREKEIGI